MDTFYRSGIPRLALATAAFLVVAAAWNLLFQAHLVTPAFTAGDNAAYFAWWRPIEWQTMAICLLAAAGFGAMAAMGFLVRGSGGAALAIGGTMAAVAQLAQMGGQHAILQASLSAIDPGVLGTIGFVADGTTHALLAGAYGSLGLGALGVTLREDAPARDALGRVAGVALGLGLLALAVLTVSDSFDVVDPLTAVVAIVLAPAWLWRLAVNSASPRESAEHAAAQSVPSA